MNKKIILSFAIGMMVFTSCAQANWLRDIFNVAMRIEGVNLDMLNGQDQMLGVQKDILASQKDINKLMHQVNEHLTSHSGWGDFQSHDYQSYGGSAHDWTSVMQMADTGRGEGALGQAIEKLNHQFPANRSTYNQGISDERNQQYYALKAQTVLAARAASQLDYNKIQDQITYQRMLQQQIEKTNDLKGAVDLSSRIQVEGNLINLEILRQTALTNQQQAVTEQSTVNTALANAKFLTK